jgi:hypothetical protein
MLFPFVTLTHQLEFSFAVLIMDVVEVIKLSFCVCKEQQLGLNVQFLLSFRPLFYVQGYRTGMEVDKAVQAPSRSRAK